MGNRLPHAWMRLCPAERTEHSLVQEHINVVAESVTAHPGTHSVPLVTPSPHDEKDDEEEENGAAPSCVCGPVGCAACSEGNGLIMQGTAAVRRRRAALEALFAECQLVAPLTLCPSTTDPAVARGWLQWTAAGLEGLCFKRLNEPYTGGARTWRKYKVRTTTEAIIGAVTGPLQAPRTVLLGRYDTAGRLQYAGRSTTLSTRFGRALGDVLARPAGTHPWQGWTFSAGWGTPRTLDVVLVEPAVVLEVAVDVARDAAGRFRHPARPHRVRTDVDVTQVPLFGEPGTEAGGP
jgi:hypothetical protein